MFYTEIIELVSTNYTNESDFYRQLIWYAHLHHTHRLSSEKLSGHHKIGVLRYYIYILVYFLAEIIEFVSSNYTSTSGLHEQLIWYAYLHQDQRLTYKKYIRKSQSRVFALLLRIIAHVFAEIIELESTNYTNTSGLHLQSIWYAYLHQTHRLPSEKYVRTSQNLDFALFWIY